MLLYLALKLKCSKDAACDVCRKPWDSRLGHRNCVRAELSKRVRCFDSRSLGSKVFSGSEVGG